MDTLTTSGPIERQPHYRVRELAALWHLSPTTITKLFRDEPDVLRIGDNHGKRQYVTLSIPASVAARVHQRLSNNALQRLNPQRVIRLRELNAGMGARKVIKGYAAKYKSLNTGVKSPGVG